MLNDLPVEVIQQVFETAINGKQSISFRPALQQASVAARASTRHIFLVVADDNETHVEAAVTIILLASSALETFTCVMQTKSMRLYTSLLGTHFPRLRTLTFCCHNGTSVYCDPTFLPDCGITFPQLQYLHLAYTSPDLFACTHGLACDFTTRAGPHLQCLWISGGTYILEPYDSYPHGGQAVPNELQAIADATREREGAVKLILLPNKRSLESQNTNAGNGWDALWLVDKGGTPWLEQNWLAARADELDPVRMAGRCTGGAPHHHLALLIQLPALWFLCQLANYKFRTNYIYIIVFPLIFQNPP
ncbi:hypothetical protein GLOTRDRAFT_125103 [Gloeophyllum trabeum ATCC 11539]|uniref:Uncharacterized protein n=1 Tax=Gloeophyllum trabeum (strain ATCC 11539 / FP-39264 / Madison 617) TaxID=670483 RepID=S7RZA5_GLOTA|nr:uncharacterized protein GLOTRDRAFT_125103 [Gloeophyllum trabeum ATCC 11539]EPQ58774.1 hypothetical protein GLOTRDRAFT_125103 [Gloeophyllum trabeum ATCC 11539]